MKKSYKIHTAEGVKEKFYSYIPLRYIIAIVLSLTMTLAVIGIVIAMCYYVPYFYLAALATQIAVVITIIASSENPDYKIPWLMTVLLLPVAGFMIYFLFHSRKPGKKYRKRMSKLMPQLELEYVNEFYDQLYSESPTAATHAKMLCSIAQTHIYQSANERYFPLGENMFAQMLIDLKTAERFIFLEYFIIEEGKFWNPILEILKEKAAQGVEVKVVYDDIGCMLTLSGDYYKTLCKYGIEAVPFSFLKGNADSEFNNRSHRKILVIDGVIGYTGGVNIADEYINVKVIHGHWKDVGLRIEGDAVKELTKLFFMDYGINAKRAPEITTEHLPTSDTEKKGGYIIPFGDGPEPFYRHRVGKSVIQNMLSAANRYMWIMTPYLIIDNELCMSLENAALRGVDVKVIVPYIPDKKLVSEMTKSYYAQLMEAGVKIYEYTPGFIHAKCYLMDDINAMAGSINLDYRSLVHHYENGIWLYKCEVIDDIKNDFLQTFEKSQRVIDKDLKTDLFHRFIRATLKLFAPLM